MAYRFWTGGSRFHTEWLGQTPVIVMSSVVPLFLVTSSALALGCVSEPFLEASENDQDSHILLNLALLQIATIQYGCQPSRIFRAPCCRLKDKATPLQIESINFPTLYPGSPKLALVRRTIDMGKKGKGQSSSTIWGDRGKSFQTPLSHAYHDNVVPHFMSAVNSIWIPNSLLLQENGAV